MQKLTLKDGVVYTMLNGVVLDDAILVLDRIFIQVEKQFYQLYAAVYSTEEAYNAKHQPVDYYNLKLSFAEVVAVETAINGCFLVSDGAGGVKLNDSVMSLLLTMNNPAVDGELIGDRWKI